MYNQTDGAYKNLELEISDSINIIKKGIRNVSMKHILSLKKPQTTADKMYNIIQEIVDLCIRNGRITTSVDDLVGLLYAEDDTNLVRNAVGILKKAGYANPQYIKGKEVGVYFSHTPDEWRQLKEYLTLPD